MDAVSHDHDAPLTGRSLIGTTLSRDPGGGEERTFRAVDPSTGADLAPSFRCATEVDVAAAGRLASAAFPTFAASSGRTRSAFLRRIAEELEARRDPIVARARHETALPEARLSGELARTTNQLRMFAELVERDEWRDPRIDRALPERSPTPRPDIRSMRTAIGPVAVFGASNFPLAFSVAGGDTASALAAGCPVIVKAHPGHPGTSELVGRAIAAAARASELPEGTFSLLFDDGHDVGQRLVGSPDVKAVGFTGSRRGGEALMRRAAERPEPIPVYAEMGSVNPIFVLPRAASARATSIAQGLHGSVMLGVGQFCTNPGVVLVPRGDAGDRIVGELVECTETTPAGTMLNAQVCANYGRGIDELRRAGARPVARGLDAAETVTAGVAALWEVGLDEVHAEPGLLSEVFGPSTLVVRYDAVDDLLRFAEVMEGQLTATLHAEPDDLDAEPGLVDVLARRAGRVVMNGYPTGVEVTPAMVHGGPFPATSDGRATSVGTRAIERFTRLVAYQDVPDAFLPTPLRDR